MKKIIFITLIVLTNFTYGQNAFNFTVLQQTYSNLASPSSINGGQVWDYDDFGPYNLPFEFTVNGISYNRFLFEDDYFMLLTPDADLDEGTGFCQISTSGAFLQDRTYTTEASTSPLGYAVEGEVGNRILKLEIRNAGFENAESLGFAENYFFVNQQIWLYESDKAIEFRYGNSNITSVDYMPDGEVLVGFGNDENGYLLSGSAAAPDYNELTPDDGDQFPVLDAYPANGTVYRFAPANTSGTEVINKQSFALYPNPANSQIFIASGAGEEQGYDIYNVLGAKVLSVKPAVGTVSVNVTSLQNGLYIVKSGNTSQKFIKK